MLYIISMKNSFCQCHSLHKVRNHISRLSKTYYENLRYKKIFEIDTGLFFALNIITKLISRWVNGKMNRTVTIGNIAMFNVSFLRISAHDDVNQALLFYLAETVH